MADDDTRKRMMAELAAGAQAHKRSQRIGMIILAVFLIGTFCFVGNCSRNSVLEAREDDAVTEFTRAYRNLGKSTPPGVFNQSEKLFDLVIANGNRYEPFVYKGLMQLLTYAWLKDRKKPEEAYITQAEKFLQEALKFNPKSVEAHYYLAAVAYFKNDTPRCLSELDETLKMADLLEEKFKAQWKTKAEASKVAMQKTPPPAIFDISAPPAMIPKNAIIKD